MKRKIAMILVGLMCVSATGCSFNPFGEKSAVDISAADTEDIFANVGEDAVIENSEASETFTNAMSAIGSAENITIKVANNIVMGKEGEDSYQESISNSEVKIVKDGENQTGNVDIENIYRYVPSAGTEGATGEGSSELTEEKSDITGYYSGDRLYFITNDGDKVQEEMSYDDFLAVVNTYTLNLFDDCISKAACVEEKDGKTYYISYDPALFETTMNTNMEASGQVMADGEAMSVKYANIIAKTDTEGNLMGYGFVINAEYINDQGTVPYNYSLEADFSDRGTTKAKAVDDMDSYMTADEYTQMMQERYSEGSTDGTEGNEDTDSTGADAAEAETSAAEESTN